MTKSEARDIIMTASQKAMEEYRSIYPPDWKKLYRNESQLNEYLAKQDEYINAVISNTIPKNIGELAF